MASSGDQSIVKGNASACRRLSNGQVQDRSKADSEQGLGDIQRRWAYERFLFWVAYFIAFGRLFRAANLSFLQPIRVFWQPDTFPTTSGQVADRKEHEAYWFAGR